MILEHLYRTSNRKSDSIRSDDALVFEFGIAFANAARKLARAFVAAEFKFLGVPDLGDAQPQFVEARAARGLTPCTKGRTEPFDTSRRSAKACRIGVWPADAGKAS